LDANLQSSVSLAVHRGRSINGREDAVDHRRDLVLLGLPYSGNVKSLAATSPARESGRCDRSSRRRLANSSSFVMSIADVADSKVLDREEAEAADVPEPYHTADRSRSPAAWAAASMIARPLPRSPGATAGHLQVTNPCFRSYLYLLKRWAIRPIEDIA
jgi:hypothetical protein